MQELHDQIRAAPSSNRQFHASDLCRLIGQAAYDARVLDVVRQFGCPKVRSNPRGPWTGGIGGGDRQVKNALFATVSRNLQALYESTDAVDHVRSVEDV